jgi:hypothetical protein
MWHYVFDQQFDLSSKGTQQMTTLKEFIREFNTDADNKPKSTTAKANSIEGQREKMIAAINQQMAIIAAEIKGEPFVNPKLNKNKEPARLMIWHWAKADGIRSKVAYGTKKIVIGKGNIGPVADLPTLSKAYGKLKDVVAAGALDEQLKAAKRTAKT